MQPVLSKMEVLMEPALFNSIEEILPVLDEGVSIDFRQMMRVAVIGVPRRRKTRYRVYVRSWIGDDEIQNKPRPTTELEEQKISIVHELIHAFSNLVRRRMPRGKDAQSEADAVIDRHAYTFLDNEQFFERLFIEMLFRDNCRMIFHKSIWRNGRAECPFYYYYQDLLERLKRRLI